MARSPKVIILAVLGMLLFPSLVSAQSDGFQRKRAEARVELIKSQLSLAEWCSLKELFLERDQVYTRILTLEPDNLDARKGLRYGRNPDGSWKDPPAREAKNRNPKGLEELPARRAKAIGRYRDTMLELLASESTDPKLRREVYDEILRFDPDDARIHDVAAETKSGDQWVLADTVAAKARRAEIKTLVQSSKSDVPAAEEAPPTPEEAALAAWNTAIGTSSMRVFSTGDEPEAQSILTTCLAAESLLNALFGFQATLPAGYTIFVLAHEGEKDGFIDKLPSLTTAERDFIRGLQSSGVNEDKHVALFDPEPRRRLDNSVRHTIGHLLHSACGVTAQCGWVWEGAGLYLTRELCGTRLTWFISKAPATEDKEQQTLRSVLLNSDTNWMNEALKLLDSEAAPKLDQVMRRDPNVMTMQDMLAAYALCAYLIESRPADAAKLFQRAGENLASPTAATDPVPAVQEILGLTIPDLEDRVRRWLKERR